jgi:hypothetical protein
MGGSFSTIDLERIDVAHRAGAATRCPHDDKPLVITSWQNGKRRMVYFLCRECTRVGAIGYESDDPNVPGRPARRSGSSARTRIR